MCKYCERKPIFVKNEIFFTIDNETDLAYKDFTNLSMGVDKEGRIYIAAYGEGTAIWYPNFCPVCGRSLREHRRYTAAIEDVPYGGI